MPAFPINQPTPPDRHSQYYRHTGRMLAGNPQLWTPSEYRTVVDQCVWTAFGVFDTAKPDHKQFGRTLQEVLGLVSTGQAQLIGPPQLKWVQSKKYGVRPILYLQWGELYDRPRQAEKSAVTPMVGRD